MRIRSITCFINPGWPLDPAAMQAAGAFIRSARPAVQAAGFEVQSTRMATVPFPQLAPPPEAVDLAVALEKSAMAEGFEYIAMGPAAPDRLDCYPVIADMLAATQSVFVTGIMADEKGVSIPAVRACAAVIQRAAGLTPDGFGNLRFAALANVAPGAPFFPAAYSNSPDIGFALAVEAADLAVTAFTGATSITSAREKLRASIETAAESLKQVCETLSKEHGVHFLGLDFTLAPYPESERSTGTAIERVGVPAIGLAGSLAAAAIVAEALDRAVYPRTGFNGLMLPVLEDFTLAARAAQGILSINDLLLYSTVCGTGLDTIPLPGDTSQTSLTAILLDVAALAMRLNKPLTARLMPIPGKTSGELTAFNFAYFANSRIMALPAAPLEGLLAGGETFDLKPRSRS